MLSTIEPLIISLDTNRQSHKTFIDDDPICKLSFNCFVLPNNNNAIGRPGRSFKEVNTLKFRLQVVEVLKDWRMLVQQVLNVIYRGSTCGE